MVDDNAYSRIIDVVKLDTYLEKVSIWKFVDISKVPYLQFSKEEKADLLLRYYDGMKARFEGKALFFPCIF